jgi:hypothetical protein
MSYYVKKVDELCKKHLKSEDLKNWESVKRALELKPRGIREPAYYDSVDEAVKAIREELIKYNYCTTRSFWVDGVKYIARKTNKGYGYVNLTMRRG